MSFRNNQTQSTFDSDSAPPEIRRVPRSPVEWRRGATNWSDLASAQRSTALSQSTPSANASGIAQSETGEVIIGWDPESLDDLSTAQAIERSKAESPYLLRAFPTTSIPQVMTQYPKSLILGRNSDHPGSIWVDLSVDPKDYQGLLERSDWSIIQNREASRLSRQGAMMTAQDWMEAYQRNHEDSQNGFESSSARMGSPESEGTIIVDEPQESVPQ